VARAAHIAGSEEEEHRTVPVEGREAERHIGRDKVVVERRTEEGVRRIVPAGEAREGHRRDDHFEAGSWVALAEVVGIVDSRLAEEDILEGDTVEAGRSLAAPAAVLRSEVNQLVVT
jgi:hypothetical protein